MSARLLLNTVEHMALEHLDGDERVDLMTAMYDPAAYQEAQQARRRQIFTEMGAIE